MSPSLSPDEVDAFESRYKIRLPEDYRNFLLRIGNGGVGPHDGLFKLGEMDGDFDLGPFDDFIGVLSEPFPHTEAWNDLAGEPAEGDDEDAVRAFEERYWDRRWIAGAIPLCHVGDSRRLWLVISGPEAGHVWCDDRAHHRGLSPLQTEASGRVTFLQWYRTWLDGMLAGWAPPRAIEKTRRPQDVRTQVRRWGWYALAAWILLNVVPEAYRPTENRWFSFVMGMFSLVGAYSVAQNVKCRETSPWGSFTSISFALFLLFLGILLLLTLAQPSQHTGIAFACALLFLGMLLALVGTVAEFSKPRLN